MPIPMRCQCGKAFRAKDELAGKTVRCPGCGQPLRIESAAPSAQANSAPAKGSSPTAAPKLKPSHKAPDVAGAEMKIDEARRKRVMTAEEEAERQTEVNKLVAAWDQVAGKGAKEGEKKGKTEKTGEKPRQETALTKVQDRVGMLKSTLLWKYVAIAVVLVGGATGSSLLISRVMKHTESEVASPTLTSKDVERLYREAEAAIKAKQWSRANDRLQDIIRIEPHRVNNVRYKDLKTQLEKGISGG